MDLMRLENLWKFLCQKNNLRLDIYNVDGVIHYVVIRPRLILDYKFPLKNSSVGYLSVYDKGFDQEHVKKNILSEKKTFGFKPTANAFQNGPQKIPSNLSTLSKKYSLKLMEDFESRNRIELYPFQSTNVFELIEIINLLSQHIKQVNFFAPLPQKISKGV
ncbi:hypothetical protein [Mongoliitalea lutea]|uniref:Uncharacterized protein n=1 Tax=Mongoliitalea lutea TaxID=849756 RepID=A0A8J3CWI2_9BACT|nr:hypothetical protein [Mongoliitalea lutea]GHB39409.1 hypothetical protein GCM10008106_20780 [Mongoliitalea lutea]